MPNLIAQAKEYISLGYSVLPIDIKLKKPAIESWKRLQSFCLTNEEVDRAFDGETNIAIIFGKVSGNLECLDFDNHLNSAAKTFANFKPVIDTFNLPYETTRSGGFHVFYRGEEPICGSKKLAMVYDALNQRPTALIETKGEGGYAVVSPSIGYKLQQGSFSEMPILTKEERDFIILECQKFNEIIEKEYEQPVNVAEPSNYGVGDRVGDKYNESPSSLNECRQLLIQHGWTFAQDGVSCARPDKKLADGISATLGKVRSRAGIPQFYVFSSNASPFEENRGYTPLCVRTTLAYAGDYAQSVMDLAKQEGTYREPKEIIKTIKRVELPPMMNQRQNGSVDIPKFIQETENKLNNVDSRMGGNSEVKPIKTPKIDQAMKFLDSLYDFRRDTITHKIEYRQKGELTWELCESNNLYLDLQHNGIDFRKDAIKCLIGSKYIPDYNPFESYFNALPKWDGVNYFELLADYVTTDDRQFFVTMMEKQFVRAIKCALEDSFYNRVVLVFENRAQETGKSRFVRYLNPFGDNYYTEEALDSGKDTQITLTETFLYNLDDLDDFEKVGGLGKLKTTLAKYSVNVRLPYGEQKVKMYRRCSFFGSSNRSEFLKDDINTRWIIFKVKMLNMGFLTELDIHKLWGQAWAKYHSEYFNWDLTIEERQKREERNLLYKVTTLEQQILVEHFRIPIDNPNKTLSLSQIAKGVAFYSGYGKSNTELTHIQDILGSMGFEPENRLIMNTYIKSYHIELINEGDINL